MLGASFFFWCRSTNYFHFSNGMMGPYFFYVSIISGVRPDGVPITPLMLLESSFNIDGCSLSYDPFISFYNQKVGRVSYLKHIAFMTLWLCAFIFCTRSIQVSKSFLSLAILLHEGLCLALGQCILAHLCDFVGEIIDAVKAREKKTNLDSSMRLLQLWLNTLLKPSLLVFASVNFMPIQLRRQPTSAILKRPTKTHPLLLRYIFFGNDISIQSSATV